MVPILYETQLDSGSWIWEIHEFFIMKAPLSLGYVELGFCLLQRKDLKGFFFFFFGLIIAMNSEQTVHSYNLHAPMKSKDFI